MNKESKRRELELLVSISKENGISAKMAQDLLKAARKFSYENVSQGTRIKEYQNLIEFYSKNK